jgi:CHAT domain-containing protein
VEAIGRLFAPNAKTLTGAVASEREIQQMAGSDSLRRYRYLHFAAHGEANCAVPMQSAILLTPEPRAPDQSKLLSAAPLYDGRLTAEQILETWYLDADLVTLSACETGLGPSVRGEHLLGFSQALLLAGTRSVIVSMWAVRDDATALLMHRFYQNLLGRREGTAPLSKAESLAEAKRWLRELTTEQLEQIRYMPSPTSRSSIRRRGSDVKVEDARPFAHPHYWAPFILIGAP